MYYDTQTKFNKYNYYNYNNYNYIVIHKKT